MKHLTRTANIIAALITVVSLFAAQMAVAAHLCPTVAAQLTAQVTANSEAAGEAPALPPCNAKHSPSGNNNSQGSTTLCQAHCTQDHRIVGDIDCKAPIQFLPAYEFTLAPVEAISDTSPIAFASHIVDARHPVKPPPILVFGQLRI